MASKIEICNMALVELNQNLVTDIDSPVTNEEKKCNAIFDILAREVMSEGSWTSCLAREELVATANTPEFEYDNEFQLPTSKECLRVLNIDEERPGSYEYSIEGDKLLTNKSEVKIRFIYYNTNVSSWDPMLVKAISQRILSKLCLTLTGDKGRAEAEYQKYLQMAADSLAINNQQGSKQKIVVRTLTDIR